MRVLMRNTVSKVATLAGLFLCMLAFAVVFSGTTDFVHATHDQAPVITADQVTEGNLEQFVQGAADAYYIDFIMKHHCDFTGFTATIPGIGMVDGGTINNLLPNLPTAQIKGFIPQFGDLDMGEYCDLSQPFHEVFGMGDGDWNSGSIYLFIMDDNGTLLYQGVDQDVEGERVVAMDERGMNVRELILDEAETPMNAGIVHYCWDDPTTEDDNIDDNDPETAPGDSLKTVYVVDPFGYLGISQPTGSSGVIFGSGIYPGVDNEFPECDGNGMADGGEEMMEEEMEEPMEETMEESMDESGEGEMEMPTDTVDSVSGGGCAIASGGESAPQSTAFNLLLLSALFLAVSFRRRVTGKRNGVQS